MKVSGTRATRSRRNGNGNAVEGAVGRVNRGRLVVDGSPFEPFSPFLKRCASSVPKYLGKICLLGGCWYRLGTVRARALARTGGLELAHLFKDPSDFGQVLLPIITERLIRKNSSHRPEMHGQCIYKALLTLAETKMGSGSIPYCFINWITHGDNLDANDKGSMGTAGTRSLHALKQADHDLTI